MFGYYEGFADFGLVVWLWFWLFVWLGWVVSSFGWICLGLFCICLFVLVCCLCWFWIFGLLFIGCFVICFGWFVVCVCLEFWFVVWVWWVGRFCFGCLFGIGIWVCEVWVLGVRLRFEFFILVLVGCFVVIFFRFLFYYDCFDVGLVGCGVVRF